MGSDRMVKVSVMNKTHILDEIRRTAKGNGGIPLGIRRFRAETGIRESDWFAKYWLRWGDALREAGFLPNVLRVGLPEDQLLEKLIALIRELGHFPIKAELRMRRVMLECCGWGGTNRRILG